MDCFVAFAPRNDADTRLPSRGAVRPSYEGRSPMKIRGRSATPRGERGKPGARCTRSRAWWVESTRVSHHRSTGTPGLPCATVLRLISSSPRGPGLFAPVIGVMPACRAREGRHRHHRQLDASVGASGPHDFAVRKPAPSSEAPPASIASQPYVRDDRETPLW
jgi:hypothetical protein